ncbi:MAG: hypothetical protein PHT33_04615 [bacterium]|nr:hypothetical protein [bacterium]
MKRIVLAIALVALFAVPAMAQDVNVDITASGEFWGTFVAPSGDEGSFFEDFSPFGPSSFFEHPNEYTFATVNGKVGNNLGFTYTYDVSFQETDQAYGSYLPNAGLVNEVRAGKFKLPIGLNEYILSFADGVALLGKVGAFDYNLAMTDSIVDGIPGDSDTAVNLKLNTNMRLARVGATVYHESDRLDLFGVDLATGIGPFGFGGEYNFLNVTDVINVKEKMLYVYGDYAYTPKTTFFVKYYNVSAVGDTVDGNKIGVAYTVSDNTTLRLMFGNGEVVDRGFEAALKTTF